MPLPASCAPQVVETAHDYPVAPELLWDVAIDWRRLGEVNRGMVTQIGLPEGRFTAGQRLEIAVSAFGLLPAKPYVIEILECDDARRTMISREHGAGVKSWNHEMRVEATPEGCRLLDRIEIDAGVLTRAFAAWARLLYRRRHKPRLRMLGLAA